jgi:hypothetical protein
MHLKFDWLIVLENLRMKERLFFNPNDESALNFFSVLHEWQCSREVL